MLPVGELTCARVTVGPEIAGGNDVGEPGEVGGVDVGDVPVAVADGEVGSAVTVMVWVGAVACEGVSSPPSPQPTIMSSGTMKHMARQ